MSYHTIGRYCFMISYLCWHESCIVRAHILNINPYQYTLTHMYNDIGHIWQVYIYMSGLPCSNNTCAHEPVCLWPICMINTPRQWRIVCITRHDHVSHWHMNMYWRIPYIPEVHYRAKVTGYNHHVVSYHVYLDDRCDIWMRVARSNIQLLSWKGRANVMLRKS